MTRHEQRAAMSLSAIFAFRMLGLFMILPVFSLYADHLHGATPLLIGMALGIYGLTQALLQIPFGMLSDKIGRKPIIAFGLVLFAVGSVIAATATSIDGVILGRALQGAGAVGSTIIALLADLTRDESRTKAMATIGLTIGVAFSLAIILGPMLNGLIHVSGIFWLTAGLAAIGIFILFSWVPTPKKSVFHRDAEPVPALFGQIIRDRQLLRLDFGIFTSHAILTANFIVIPLILSEVIHIPQAHQWILYLPVLLLSFIAMVPMIIIAEKRRKMKSMFVLSIVLMLATQFGLSLWHHSAWMVGILLFVFFTAFTFMEASLPSLVSKLAPVGSKGTAMGVYSTSQFLGIFVGGVVGGWLFGLHDFASVFFACGVIATVWFLLASTMAEPQYLATKSIAIDGIAANEMSELADELKALPGVADVMLAIEEGVAYLKVDSKVYQAESVKALLG